MNTQYKSDKTDKSIPNRRFNSVSQIPTQRNSRHAPVLRLCARPPGGQVTTVNRTSTCTQATTITSAPTTRLLTNPPPWVPLERTVTKIQPPQWLQCPLPHKRARRLPISSDQSTTYYSCNISSVGYFCFLSTPLDIHCACVTCELWPSQNKWVLWTRLRWKVYSSLKVGINEVEEFTQERKREKKEF